MQHDPVVIVSYVRTPIGNLLGELKTFSAHELGSVVIQALLERSLLKPAHIDEVLMGCVLPAGQGQAPARQAALGAKLPAKVSCTTVNKVCGSGLKTVMLAHDGILLDDNAIMIAGGMESMTQAPYLLLKGRQGYRFGSDKLYDHMTLDGLEDAYDRGQAMGFFADQCAEKYHFSREMQDAFAILSFERARKAIDKHFFEKEIVPITFKAKHEQVIIDQDEHPFSVKIEKIPTLSAVFSKEGTVTAGNSSSIADGAAGVLLMRLSQAEKLGVTPLAKIIGHASFSKNPDEFTTAPIGAMEKLLAKLNMTVNDIDLFEINEAFAVVTLVTMKALNIPEDKVNIHGGACALGHPIGASGARILVTLLSALEENSLKRGMASLCIGGGEAVALAVERWI